MSNQELLTALMAKEVAPRTIVGTGYKNGRQVAIDYLKEMIAKESEGDDVETVSWSSSNPTGERASGEIHKCAECSNMTEDMGYKVQDSFHGLQYLCSQDCVDTYEGWWCDTCDLLHDHGTTMESDNSCQRESE
jgi:hypothetical protein